MFQETIKKGDFIVLKVNNTIISGKVWYVIYDSSYGIHLEYFIIDSQQGNNFGCWREKRDGGSILFHGSEEDQLKFLTYLESK